MANDYLFTSESVSEGHPDKVADQISDAVLDAILEQDQRGRVACETLVKTGVVDRGRRDHDQAPGSTSRRWCARPCSTSATTTPTIGFDGASCGVLNIIGKQSPDIAQGVDRKDERKQGAGDQGLMFGYACNETDVLMPAPITSRTAWSSARRRCARHGKLPWLRPDAKSQVTLRYEDDKPVGHRRRGAVDPAQPRRVAPRTLREAVIEEILKPVLPAKWLDKRTKYHINPTGRFVIGGPVGDCGLTGRKIIVDTYGGYARHGGGAFSGKDPSKVDRSAAYAARYVAKNIVAAGLAERCEVQVSLRHRRRRADLDHGRDLRHRPAVATRRSTQLVRKHFDLRPTGMREMLDLLRPIYQKTAAYGHFGRTEPEFTWERTDKAAALAADARRKAACTRRPERTRSMPAAFAPQRAPAEERCDRRSAASSRQRLPGSADGA